MEKERSIDRLARYTINLGIIAAICAVCWIFRSALLYIILAGIVALVAKPIKKVLRKISFRGKKLPDWLCALVTLLLFLLLVIGFITLIIPVTVSIVQQISANLQSSSLTTSNVSTVIDDINAWIIATFPQVGSDFNIQAALTKFIGDAFNFQSVSSMIGQIASTVGTLGVGLFCVMFIAFFFIKSDGLFSKIVCALVPDKYEEKASKATANIEYLLSRYFFGIVCEILLVALLDFLGLWAVARLGFSTALGIGFMCGIMNVIPYVGPWLGGALGTVLGISLKYSQAVALGGTFNFWVTLIILICCFVFTQWIDNFGLQPLIYSTSIKSTPLEIFIVIILAGKIGGILGMVAAVPAYTVIRVVAAEFFSDVKAVRRLIQASEKQPEPQPSDNGKIEGK